MFCWFRRCRRRPVAGPSDGMTSCSRLRHMRTTAVLCRSELFSFDVMELLSLSHFVHLLEVVTARCETTKLSPQCLGQSLVTSPLTSEHLDTACRMELAISVLNCRKAGQPEVSGRARGRAHGRRVRNWTNSCLVLTTYCKQGHGKDKFHQAVALHGSA
eukprot:6177256-Pleurochrysis_carterae.AAC.2